MYINIVIHMCIYIHIHILYVCVSYSIKEKLWIFHGHIFGRVHIRVQWFLVRYEVPRVICGSYIYNVGPPNVM